MDSFKKVLDLLTLNEDVVLIYNDNSYIIQNVYNIKGEKIGYKFNDIKYKDLDYLLRTAFIDNVVLKDIILKATDVYAN